MIKYLTDNFNFTQVKENKAKNIIVNSTNTFGINSLLTWLNNNVRAKIYNKFVSQITSPGVNKTGHHIINFLNCPDERPRNTFCDPRTKLHGITRLEEKVHNYSTFEDSFCKDPIKDCDYLKAIKMLM